MQKKTNKYLDTFITYLVSEKRYSKHTSVSYYSDISQFEKFLAEVSLENVNTKFVREWIMDMNEKNFNSTSINRKIVSLRQFYRFLERENVIKVNPLKNISALKTNSRLPHFVKENELSNLFSDSNFETNFETQEKLIFELFISTGLRLNELININTKDIDFENKKIKILGKGNKERIVFFTEKLAIKLSNFIEKENRKNDYLFQTKKNKKLYPVHIQRTISKIIKLYSNTSKKSPHVLRHTFATLFLNNGADIMSVKELLGHSSVNSTQIYTHVDINKLKSSYKKFHPKS